METELQEFDMDMFLKFMELCAALPDLVVLLVCPALLLIAGILLAVFGEKKLYPIFSVILGGAGGFLVICKDPFIGLAYLALFVAFAGLVSLLFLIPFGRKEKAEDQTQEELYEKFALPLELPEEEESFEEERFDREESGLRLEHTQNLLEQLKKSELTAGDRLEADALSRTLEGYRDRELTADEMRALNDCLATVLKLTAKYKL